MGCGIGGFYYIHSNKKTDTPKADTDKETPKTEDKFENNSNNEEEKGDEQIHTEKETENQSNINQESNNQTTTNQQSNTNQEKNKPSNVQTSNKQPSNNNSTDDDKETNSSKVVGKTTKGYDIICQDGVYYVKGILIANKTYALPSQYNPGGLTSEFNTAFNDMKAAAKKDGIDLVIKSGFRSYSTQNRIYNNYVARDGQAIADTYSARPGHSEHQSGLAADLNDISDDFAGTPEAIWLENNCYKYGFILRYPKGKQEITGYKYEPWHFRYIGEEAINLYNDGDWITLEEYLGIDSKY